MILSRPSLAKSPLSSVKPSLSRTKLSLSRAKPSLSRAKPLLALAALGAMTAASAGPAAAQVTYAPAAQPSFFGFFNQPYDESGDTQPTYAIRPDATRGPIVRVIQRCAYIGGWNVGDFDRNLNGVPLGIGHTCPADSERGAVRARY